MTDAIVASHFRRIVDAWYQWQRVNLRERGRAPGDSNAGPKPWQSRAQVIWGAPPPRMADDSTLIT